MSIKIPSTNPLSLRERAGVRVTPSVIPAKAGIQEGRLRGNPLSLRERAGVRVTQPPIP